jgi:hypothetical protein
MGRDMEEQLTQWRKSTRSGNGGDSCVELAAWRKSAHSSNGGDTCVEVASTEACACRYERSIAVRDSKNPEGHRLHFHPATWRTFTQSLKDN